MSDWLGINNVVKVLEEVGVQVVVLAGQRVEVNHHIFLRCDVVHHMDEVQQGLHMQTHTKSVLWSLGSHLLFSHWKAKRILIGLQLLCAKGIEQYIQYVHAHTHTHKIHLHSLYTVTSKCNYWLTHERAHNYSKCAKMHLLKQRQMRRNVSMQLRWILAKTCAHRHTDKVKPIIQKSILIWNLFEVDKGNWDVSSNQNHHRPPTQIHTWRQDQTHTDRFGLKQTEKQKDEL